MLLRAAPPAPKQGRTVQVKNDVLTPHPRPQTACPVPAAPVPGLRQASVIGRQARSGVVGLLEREGELAAAVGVLDHGGVLMVEGGAGIGKSALLDAVCGRAAQAGWQVVRARGSELEAGFAFGVVRQLFERHLAELDPDDRAELLAGQAAATRPLWGEAGAGAARDTSFAVLHGLYWLTANLAAAGPVLVVVDDAHWADGPSLRWLAYLAPRMGGLAAGLLVAWRHGDPAAIGAPLLAVRAEAAAVLRPALLTEDAVRAWVRAAAGGAAGDELCAAAYAACGGNPLYLTEMLRAAGRDGRPLAVLGPGELLTGGLEGIARAVIARVRGLGAEALGLAQAIAVLGDGCELRHAAQTAGMEMGSASRLAEGLVRS